LRRFFVHVPYRAFVDRFEDVITRGLSPEIVLDGMTLDGFDRREAQGLAEKLHTEGLETTIHGPFSDLSPGGADPKVLAVTRERFDQTMAVAEIFRPQCVVFHPGYDPWRFQGYEDVWLENSLETWALVVERAGRIDVTVAIENVFEKNPTTILSLLEGIQSPHFRHCLDVGHINLFGNIPMAQWVEAMAPYIAEIHVHDNRGEKDDHLPIGRGDIDFRRLFRLIRRYAKDEPVWCLEPNHEDDIEPSIRAFTKLMNHTMGSGRFARP
jgi:sugar phosphate isomerase/epimerase